LLNDLTYKSVHTHSHEGKIINKRFDLYVIGHRDLRCRRHNVGKISKYNIERLEARNIELRFDCPYCGSARIGIKFKNQMDYWDGIVCPKCKSRVILDNLSLTVVHASELKEEAVPAMTESITMP